MATLTENSTSHILRSRIKDFCERGAERRQALEDIGNRQEKVSARKKEDCEKELKENVKEKVQPGNDEANIGENNTVNVADIDKAFESNLFLVPTYAKDVYAYLMHLEKKRSLPMWPFKNTHISSTMRYKLLDWLVDVQEHYSLLQETFQLSVSIIDHYLNVDTELKKELLQLLGITALSLAAKYEELHPLSLNELVNLCDSAYSQKKIVSMEFQVLKALGFNLSRPVCITFLRRFSMAASGNKVQHTFAKYFADVALFQAKICHTRPSLIASAAIFLSLVVSFERLDFSLWSETLVTYTSYTIAEVLPVAKAMAKSVQVMATSKYKSVFIKYSKTELAQVSSRTTTPEINDILTKLCSAQLVK